MSQPSELWVDEGCVRVGGCTAFAVEVRLLFAFIRSRATFRNALHDGKFVLCARSGPIPSGHLCAQRADKSVCIGHRRASRNCKGCAQFRNVDVGQATESETASKTRRPIGVVNTPARARRVCFEIHFPIRVLGNMLSNKNSMRILCATPPPQTRRNIAIETLENISIRFVIETITIWNDMRECETPSRSITRVNCLFKINSSNTP